ncbi:MAG TPA: hypothetical protein V6D17_13385 [Candidatus Obscuribacterales bacterium]
MFVNPFSLVYTLLYLFGLLLVRNYIINNPAVTSLRQRFPVIQQASWLATLVLGFLLFAYDNWVFSGWLDTVFGGLSIVLGLIAVLKIYQLLFGNGSNPLARLFRRNRQS